MRMGGKVTIIFALKQERNWTSVGRGEGLCWFCLQGNMGISVEFEVAEKKKGKGRLQCLYDRVHEMIQWIHICSEKCFRQSSIAWRFPASNVENRRHFEIQKHRRTPISSQKFSTPISLFWCSQARTKAGWFEVRWEGLVGRLGWFLEEVTLWGPQEVIITFSLL